MPVDTYLKRKNLSRYRTLEIEGVRVHVASALDGWAERIDVDAERFLFWRRFVVDVTHRHRPT